MYGVIWESDTGLVFASKDVHEAYLSDGPVVTKSKLMPISEDDVMAAEMIS